MTTTRLVRRALFWLSVSLAAAVIPVRTSAQQPSCAAFRGVRSQVEDVDAGVALTLRVAGSGLAVLSLQDYVGHVVDAWNAAEEGVIQRCAPRIGVGRAATRIASTAELTKIPDGVRVVFKPLDPRHLALLRGHVHRRGARTLSCACTVATAGAHAGRRGAVRAGPAALDA